MSRTVKKPDPDATALAEQAAAEADACLANILIPNDVVPPSEATALIEVAAGNKILAPYNPDPEGRRRLATSIDLSTPAGRLLAYRAATTEDHKAEDVIGQVFPVRNWLQHDCQRVDDKTGEIQKWVRTVLIAEDGTRISCGSDGVIGSLMSLEAFYGRPPWSPAAHLSIKTGRSRAGRTFYTLDVH